MQMSRQQPELH